MFLGNSQFLMLLNTFVDKISSTDMKFIRFQLQSMIMLGFGKCINCHNVSQRCNVYALGPYTRVTKKTILRGIFNDLSRFTFFEYSFEGMWLLGSSFKGDHILQRIFPELSMLQSPSERILEGMPFLISSIEDEFQSLTALSFLYFSVQ